MSGNPMTNLDIQCAELGRQLASISGVEEKIINAALTVLEEQGPYAMFLYLQSRHGNVANDVGQRSLSFLKDVFSERLDEVNNILDAVKELANDLDDLLFARELLHTALSYARYHLKVQGGDAL